MIPRNLQLKLALLRHMQACEDLNTLSSDMALFNDCRGAVVPAAGIAEMRSTLLAMERDNLILRVVDDGLTTFMLTGLGRGTLLKHLEA